MADPRSELEELRRLDQLEAKARGETTGGGAALITPKQRATPSTPEQKERVKSISENIGEYFFTPPNREDFDFSEMGTVAGLGAGLGAAAPKVLKTGGKIISKIPSPYGITKVVGGSASALGELLGKVPLSKRLIGGGVAGGVGEATEQTGEMMGFPRVATIPASLVAGGTAAKGFDYIEKATGLRAGSLAKSLREEGVEKVKEVLEKAGLTKAQAQSELDAALATQKQLAGREEKATQRYGEKQAILPEAQVRQTVADKARQASALAQESARLAGLDTQKAASLAAEASQGIVAAENAINNLEQQMIANPQMNKEQFGSIIQNAAKKYQTDYSKIRAKESGLSEAINAPGVVNTSGIINVADTIKKSSRVKVLNQMLEDVKSLAKTDGSNALSVKSADSLKGQIDSWINSKQYGDTKLDKEVIHELRNVKRKLIESMPKEYVEALGKYRTLSRPLDIVERNGALAKVVEADPMSLDYKMREAEVVGNVISKARAGNPVFTRLLEKNSDIKDAARLYFTKELFGQEAAPTVTGLNNFLKTNEIPLRQLGLYEEFKDLRNAKRAAQMAVNDAKEVEAGAKQQLTGAKKTETELEAEANRLKRRGNLAESRLSEALKTTEPLESVLRRSASRARQFEVETGQRVKAAEKSLNTQQAIEKEFESLGHDLSSRSITRNKDIPSEITSLADRLFKLNHISQEERNEMVRLATENEKQWEDTNKARRVLGAIGTAIGVPALAYKFYGPGQAGQ